MPNDSTIFTGIEIGTYSIKVIIAEITPDDKIKILGGAEELSISVIKAEIDKLWVVREQIEKALNIAETSVGREIDNIIFAVTGKHIKSTNNSGSVIIRDSSHKVRDLDIKNAAENAAAISLPPTDYLIHNLDRRYILDGELESLNPIDNIANKLDVEVHIIYGNRNRLATVSSLIKEITSSDPADLVFSGIADAFCVFDENDRKNGSLVINIGHGVTEYSLFQGVSCMHSGQICIGCQNVENDLAIAFNLSNKKCRQIIISNGAAIHKGDGRDRLLNISGSSKNERHIPLSTIEQIMECRLKELFQEIKDDLEKNNVLSRLNGRILITGGGSLIKKITILAERVFDSPVEIGKPINVSQIADKFNNPRFTTPIGLIHHAHYMKKIIDYSHPSLWEQTKKDIKDAWILLKRSFKI